MKSHAAKAREEKLAKQEQQKLKVAQAQEEQRKATEEKLAKRRAAERKSAQVSTSQDIDKAKKNDRPLSPARQKFQQAKAAAEAGKANANKPQTGDQYELMAAALWEARRTLKGIKSIEAKVAKKAELLPQFAPYTQGVLEQGNGAQDDVLMTCMVWFFDIGDLDSGLEIAEYALRHNLNTPDHYDRDTASLVAEQVADEAMKFLASEITDVDGLLGTLHRAFALTESADMHDQIRAKLHKALGYAWREKGELHPALENFNRALALNDRAGVKKDIEKLEREIKNAEAKDNT